VIGWIGGIDDGREERQNGRTENEVASEGEEKENGGKRRGWEGGGRGGGAHSLQKINNAGRAF
jgi:hypothetical protein